MKLRNKKNGKIEECVVIPIDENGYPNEFRVFEKGESLAELNEEWEDMPEEPKEFYFITESGEVCSTMEYDDVGLYKEIGNYFETKEEAEKVLEKLKAWKRLKDKEFKFCALDYINHDVIYFEFFRAPLTQSEIHEAEKDLEICFGGDE